MSLSPDQKLAAYFLGRRIAGQRRKQDRVPVAYLVNGIRVPVFPEQDMGKPYAILNYSDLSAIDAGAFVVELIVGSDQFTNHPTSNAGIYKIKMPGSYVWYNFTNSEYVAEGLGISAANEWVVNKTGEDGFEKNGPEDHFEWANHNVMNEDGSIFLEGSAPIPVYE